MAVMKNEEHALLPGNQVHCESGPGKAPPCVPAGFPTAGFSPGHCSIKLLEIKTSVYNGKCFCFVFLILQANMPRWLFLDVGLC